MNPFSLLNPVTPWKGLAHIGLIPGFLKGLWRDCQALRTPDLPVTVVVLGREQFPDDATHRSVAIAVKRQHRLAVVRQAVEKQLIRQTLWPRIAVCLLIFSPLTLPFCMLVVMIWASCMVYSHRVFELVSLGAFHF